MLKIINTLVLRLPEYKGLDAKQGILVYKKNPGGGKMNCHHHLKVNIDEFLRNGNVRFLTKKNYYSQIEIFYDGKTKTEAGKTALEYRE